MTLRAIAIAGAVANLALALALLSPLNAAIGVAVLAAAWLDRS